MPLLDINNYELIERYRRFLQTHPNGDFFQDPNWSIVKENWEKDHAYLEENGEIVAAISVLSVPAIDNRYFMYAARGPVSDFYDIETTKRLLDELAPVIEKRNPFLFRMDPKVELDTDLVEAYRNAGFVFRSHGTDIRTMTNSHLNMVLDLKDKTEDELLASFSSKTRYNIRLSDRKGVTTTWGRSDEYVEIFHNLTKIMSERQGIKYRPLDYFKRVIAAFPEARIYISWFEDEPLSAALAMPYNGTLHYLYGASSNEKRNLMPNHHMQWEMIKWALEMGKTDYNFDGVWSFTDEDGVYRFKHGFCQGKGEIEWIGELDVVYDQELYQRFITR